MKEGIEEFPTKSTLSGKAYTFNGINESYKTPQEAFAYLINKVNRKDVWKENPYVFVYDFELLNEKERIVREDFSNGDIQYRVQKK